MKFMNRSKIVDLTIQKIYLIAYKLKLLYNVIIFPNAYGVYIAVWSEGEILIIKNSYKKYYTLPCGGLKKNEDAKIGAVRELLEEVNINASTKDLIFAGTFISMSEYMNDHITLYELYFPDFPRFHCDNREVIWAEFKKPEEALKMNLFPLIKTYLSVKSGLKQI